MSNQEALSRVEMVAYDPAWPDVYRGEHAALMTLCGPEILELEHIGSTAVPGLTAKPIIDMMAAVARLDQGRTIVMGLEARGYLLIETGMRNRLFLRRRADDGRIFQLHIVERTNWDERKERLMRDYLLSHPDAVAAYGALKVGLAAEHADDSMAYTEAKTNFIQGLVDKARAALGLPPINVWND